MKFFETDDGERVIAQRPNPPIIAAFGLWALARVSSGDISDVLSVISAFFFIAWGLMEVFWGVNYWRKSLGAVVIVITLITYL